MWPPRNPPPTWPSRQRPGETAGERRRGRRYGADVPTLTGPDFVLTSGAQVAPTCGAVAGEPRRASGARASAAVGAMSFLVLRSRSSRCQRLSAERPPVHATARSDPTTLPPHGRRASDRASGARASAAVGAMSFLVLRSRSSRCQRLGVERPPVHATRRGDPATLPPQSRRASDPLRRLARPRRSPCLEKTLIASPICGRSGQLHFSAKKIR